MKDRNFTPRSYGIATRTRKFSEWGCGDELTTHTGRRALTHGGVDETKRCVPATYLDAPDHQLILYGHTIPLEEIGKHVGYARAYDRPAYHELMNRIADARKRLSGAAAPVAKPTRTRKKKETA